jgi:hypothetical protein
MCSVLLHLRPLDPSLLTTEAEVPIRAATTVCDRDFFSRSEASRRASLRRASASVTSLGKDGLRDAAAPAPQHCVQPLRQPDAQALQTPRQGSARVRLDDQMQMIAQDRELHQP